MSAGAWVALPLMLLAAMGAPGAEDGAEPLRELRRAIEERRELVAAFVREQRGLLEALQAIDRLSAVLSADVARAWREVRESRARTSELTERSTRLEARLAGTRRAMARRAVALYKTGDVGPVQVLFAAADLRELLGRAEALRRLLEHDRRLVSRYRGERRALSAAREEAREAAASGERALARLRQRSRELRGERAGKRQLLAQVRADRARERAVLAELERAARALEATLDRLPATPVDPLPHPGGPPFESRRGRLVRPVDGPVVVRFGRAVDLEFHTQIARKGVEFEAMRGAPVRAVAPGRVRFAGWFLGYGRLVIIDHRDGFFTVSGHLQEIRVAVGDPVETGEVIGTVGESGSLAGPRLYFEIRRGREPEDPLRWIVGGASG